jgi:excisionase family DNA binding protein
VSNSAVLSDNTLKRYVAPSEAARRLGLSGSRVRQLIAEGHLSAVVTPLGRIIAVADVEAEQARRLGASLGGESESRGAGG